MKLLLLLLLAPMLAQAQINPHDDLYRNWGRAAPASSTPNTVQLDPDDDTRICIDRQDYALLAHGLAAGCDYVRAVFTQTPEQVFAGVRASAYTLGARNTSVLAFRGNNTLNQSSAGAAAAFGKSNWMADTVTMFAWAEGQHIPRGEEVDCLGVGDCLFDSQVMRSYGGLRDSADEGAHNRDYLITEAPDTTSGPCVQGCTAGSTLVSVGGQNNDQPPAFGQGRFLADTSKAVAGAGTIADAPRNTPLPEAQIDGANFALGVTLHTTADILSARGGVAPGTVTVPVDSTAGIAASGLACVSDQDAFFTYFETAPYALTGGNRVHPGASLQLTLRRPHAAGAAIYIGPLCGWGIVQNADTVSPGNGNAPIETVYPILGVLNSTTLIYDGKKTRTIGDMGSNGGYFNRTCSGSFSRSGGVVTATMPDDWHRCSELAGRPLTVFGAPVILTLISEDGSGQNAVFTGPQPGPDIAASGQTVNAHGDLSYKLVPMAEMIDVYDAAHQTVTGQNIVLAANAMPLQPGDTLTALHFHSQGTGITDSDHVVSYAPQVYFDGGRQFDYGGNGGIVPAMFFGVGVANSEDRRYLREFGGTHQAPASAYQSRGAWHSLLDGDLMPGGSALTLHCWPDQDCSDARGRSLVSLPDSGGGIRLTRDAVSFNGIRVEQDGVDLQAEIEALKAQVQALEQASRP